MGPPSEADQKVTEVLQKIAKKIDRSITAVALAWVIRKAPYVFPIVGGRKPQHLLENAQAVGIKLTDEEMKEIEDAIPFDYGFPGNTIGPSPKTIHLLNESAYHDWVDDLKAIQFEDQ